MPPHLHPRSSATTTLFASTLAASFIIVGIPHVFPCPAPRKGYLDAEGNVTQRRRRRRTPEHEEGSTDDGVEGHERQSGKEDAPTFGLDKELKSLLGMAGMGNSDREGTPPEMSGKGEVRARAEEEEEEEEVRMQFQDLKDEAVVREREGRECPVPKPKGKIGELLGFGRDGQRKRAEDERR